jgi:serine/threonine-protein kinase HipA
MDLYFVGETLDRQTAHAKAASGGLTQLVRGIYVRADADIDAIVLGHAVRIARYLYPRAYLASASAVLLGPLSDGRLFISGRRNQRTRIRGLEIVQNQAPAQPSTATAVIGDASGEFRIEASSPRQRFLEAFRLRSEHASAIDTQMRADMAARLMAEFKSPEAAADACWQLARQLGWYREGEGAERFLRGRLDTAERFVNKAAVERVVAWHGEPIGQLQHDGFEWRWMPGGVRSPLIVRQPTPGSLPPFLESLLPEGWLAQVLRQRDDREAIRDGRRFMSNITLAATRKELAALPADVLGAPLSRFTRAGQFTGDYAGPARGALEQGFEANLARVFAHKTVPRLSGVQIKAPMSLAGDGTLIPAIETPFTHILKPAGTGGFEMLPIVEYCCLELGRAVGFQVPDAAIVAMPDGMAPALLVERFDIRRDSSDNRRIVLEDFCSLLAVPASAKYDGTIERAARAMRSLVTDPQVELERLFGRALFAWMICDGDMHLKNLALLKVAAPAASTFGQVSLAPLYDAVTTRVFPGLSADRMALKLNGKDDRLVRSDFLALARTIELPAARAEAMLNDMPAALKAATERMSWPDIAGARTATEIMERVKALIAERCSSLIRA